MKAEWADSTLSFRCCLDADDLPKAKPSNDGEAGEETE